jgi:hypothetical protein
MENNFLRISIVIIINIFVVLFINLLLLHDCNYAIVEENLWNRIVSIFILTKGDAGRPFL